MPLPRRLLSTALTLSALAALTALSGCAGPHTVDAAAGTSTWSNGDDPAGAPGSGNGGNKGGGAHATLTTADGYIPTGSSLPLDSDEPAVSKLDPDLLSALRKARAAALDRGTDLTIADGWRSLRYQEQLFADAVQKYGSEEEASRWVKRGADSGHVSGHAVDLATADAMDFVSRFGSQWGLCQAYANEAWHFELSTEPEGECPAPAADGRG
jgi:zinc D-Ala-D-Ala carboxypeptidase